MAFFLVLHGLYCYRASDGKRMQLVDGCGFCTAAPSSFFALAREKKHPELMSVIVRPPTLLRRLIYVPIKRMLTPLVRRRGLFFFQFADNMKGSVKYMLLIILESTGESVTLPNCRLVTFLILYYCVFYTYRAICSIIIIRISRNKRHRLNYFRKIISYYSLPLFFF